ncbi:hypothetical protein E2C01_043918 [Portunus trituberculatus]|uniref:Uncharacterized protein n=1 Tax=Portunus trituberculatus TaxID=210409 RepID=A0A5B7G0T3_PORTR|nr:hypothetical protein [Portunus trituberculatus]
MTWGSSVFLTRAAPRHITAVLRSCSPVDRLSRHKLRDPCNEEKTARVGRGGRRMGEDHGSLLSPPVPSSRPLPNGETFFPPSGSARVAGVSGGGGTEKGVRQISGVGACGRRRRGLTMSPRLCGRVLYGRRQSPRPPSAANPNMGTKTVKLPRWFLA